jgi:hypothetical protein
MSWVDDVVGDFPGDAVRPDLALLGRGEQAVVRGDRSEKRSVVELGTYSTHGRLFETHATERNGICQQMLL